MTDTRAVPELSTPPSPPNRRAIAWWWVAAIFVVAVVIAVVAVVVLTPGRESTPPPLTGAPAPCRDVPAGSQDVPTSTPAEIEWKVSESKTVLPFSTSAGPTQVQGPLARCYARDPLGALLAASQIYGRILGPNGEENAQVARQQLIPGPQRDRFVESLSTPSTAPEQIQWRAFKYLSYTADSARIDMVVESVSTGTVAGIPMDLEWRDGDWKWNFESFTADQVHPIDSAELGTYVPWSGIR